jgi:hypothetical protein
VKCGPWSNFFYIVTPFYYYSHYLVSRILQLFSTWYSHTFVYSKPVRLTTSSYVGSKVLGCVVSRFRVATSWRRTNKNRKRRPCWSVTKLASITFLSLAFSYWIDKSWFLTKGKFATVLIIPSSWGSQLGGHPARIKHNFLAPLLRRKKTFARGVPHAHPLLCFSFALLYFCLHLFYQKYKKISFLYSCYFITLSSLCCSLSTLWRISQ